MSGGIKMGNNRFDLLSLGEILLRLSPPDNERIVSGETFQKQVGGAELNVVSGVSILGLRTGVVSKLPDNALGIYAKDKVRFCGVSDDFLVYDDSQDANTTVERLMYEALAPLFATPLTFEEFHSTATNPYGIISADMVGPSVASDITRNSFIAVFIGLFAIPEILKAVAGGGGADPPARGIGVRARRLRSQWFARPSRSADLTGGGIALFLFQVKVLGSAMSLPFPYGPRDP